MLYTLIITIMLVSPYSTRPAIGASTIKVERLMSLEACQEAYRDIRKGLLAADSGFAGKAITGSCIKVRA